MTPARAVSTAVAATARLMARSGDGRVGSGKQTSR